MVSTRTKKFLARLTLPPASSSFNGVVMTLLNARCCHSRCCWKGYQQKAIYFRLLLTKSSIFPFGTAVQLLLQRWQLFSYPLNHLDDLINLFLVQKRVLKECWAAFIPRLLLYCPPAFPEEQPKAKHNQTTLVAICNLGLAKQSQCTLELLHLKMNLLRKIHFCPIPRCPGW